MPKGLQSYAVKPRREIKEFFMTVTVQQIGFGLVSIFEPIYLYQLGYSFADIMLYVLAVYIPYFFLIPLGGNFAKRFGYEHTLAVGTFFNIAYIVALFALPSAPALIFIVPFLLTLQKTFWWPAYHANFARFGKKKEMGREVGLLQALYVASSGIGPLLGGVIVAFTGFNALFIIAIVVLAASIIPLFTTPEKFKARDLKWADQMRFFFSRNNWRMIVGSFGFGSDLIAYTLWPLFIYFILGNTAELGVVVAVSTTLTMIITVMAGRLSDKFGWRNVFTWSALLQSITWLLRPLGITFGPITASNVVGTATTSVMYVPYYSGIYNQAKKNHVMATVVAAEMGLILGKILIAAVLFVLLQFTDSLQLTFLVGFAFSLFYLLLRRVY